MSKRLLLVVIVLGAVPSMGCAYLRDRGRDFVDIWRVEGSVGVGLHAHVTATELAHIGVGSSRRYVAGIMYGEGTSERRIEDDFPLSYVWTIADPETESLHSLRWGNSNEGAAQHRCFWMVPGELNRNTYERDVLHYFDIEVGVFAAIVGFEVGFSIGELFDFIVGLFGFDLGNDDGNEARQAKRMWQKVPEQSTDPQRNK